MTSLEASDKMESENQTSEENLECLDRNLRKKTALMTVAATVAVVSAVVVVVALQVQGDDASPVPNLSDNRPAIEPFQGSLSERNQTNPNEEGPYTREDYMEARECHIRKDVSRALGARLQLSEQEKQLDEILLKEKASIIERSRVDRLDYMPALSFFKSKPWIESTNTFKIIRKMPKGAALHLHEPAIASLEWLVKNATYRDNVYMCMDKEFFILLGVFEQPPDNPECQWKAVKDERASANSREEFDALLIKNLSLLTSDPLVTYQGVNKVWKRFEKYFSQVIPLIFHVPILKDYFRQALQEFREDNVQYIEMRGGMYGYSELSGKVLDATEGVALFKEVSDDFVREHPDFVGAGLIMSGLRFKPKAAIGEEVEMAKQLRATFPHDVFLGYDLVAQEDTLNPLMFYLDQLLAGRSGEEALPYFFHAGETNWQGTVVDENLYDAILLGTTRIGHGYALAKHPHLIDEVKKRDIAVEITPISNQLLGLVSDLRNHALVPLLADDFPLVISSDDPATWEALPLSHDFFVAFMDMSSQHMGLAFLKQLAINSIKYSGMSQPKKHTTFRLWLTKWDEFVSKAIQEFSS